MSNTRCETRSAALARTQTGRQSIAVPRDRPIRPVQRSPAWPQDLATRDQWNFIAYATSLVDSKFYLLM